MKDVAALATVLVAAVAALLGLWLRAGQRRSQVVRGRRLVDERSAVRTAERHPRTVESRITWGGIGLPRAAETSHFAVVGTTGSGKTLLLTRLMGEALADAGGNADTRALVYDAKSDAMATIARLGLRLPVVSLHPFDRRCAQWDMAADVTAPAAALQAAAIFIPEEEGSANRYFSDAARDLLAGAMLSLTASGVRWTLRDVLLTMRSRERLAEVLAGTAEGRAIFELHSGEPRAFQNVLSTARTRLAPLEPVAACWSHASGRVSLREWIEGECILILGTDDGSRAAMDALNRAMFQRAVELCLRQADSTTRRTWFFLDEVRELGKLEGLGRLLNKGRSRGASVALGFQDTHGLEAVYGRPIARELIGQCSNKAILRLESAETARWAAGELGQVEERRWLRNESRRGMLGRIAGRGASEQRTIVDVVLPSEFLSLPPTSAANGLTGYFTSPHTGALRRTLPLAELLPPRQGEVAATGERAERDEREQYLCEWNAQERVELGLGVERERERDEERRAVREYGLEEDRGVLWPLRARRGGRG